MPGDYRETLNLPKTDFSMKANLAEREPAMLEFWKEHRVYENLVDNNRALGGRTFLFFMTVLPMQMAIFI